ncbi:MAG: M14 family metallocarboxypeptidase [Clostridiales bacterium]|jgi:g-D-glutamyl-meso-diaminopimelate peptidase|nr:M14 family metallocarboxypeptidase [Clostridiales bacterium]
MIEIREYSYDELEKDIYVCKSRFPFLEVDSIGQSVCGREIYSLTLGSKAAKTHVFFNGAHHGMEWVTSWVLMRYIEDVCGNFAKNKPIGDYILRQYLQNARLYFVPMVNPDGVTISLAGAEKWQSNANGVDLNHNYPADWQQVKDRPGNTRYGGPVPASEPETRAIMKFTERINFNRVFALHSQGEEIYWDFKEIYVRGARELAERMSVVSGYVVSRPEGVSSFGGYKDWFIQTFHRPGYTIELGKGENPLPLRDFEGIYSKAREMLLLGGKAEARATVDTAKDL